MAVELGHLATFLAVYRSENLTSASRALHLSQPAVSAHLKALEAELGSPLFVRLARGVTPTPLARQLADEVATPLDALHDVARTRHPATSPAKATCFLGGPSDALAELVLPALVPLVAAGLRLRVRTGLTDPLLHALGDGELDLVIATTPTRRRNVLTQPLLVERLQLVGAASLLERLDAPGLSQDVVGILRTVPLLAYDETAPLVRRYFRDQFPGVAPPVPQVTVNDLRALGALAAAGAGWTVVPDYLRTRGDGLVLLHRPAEAPTNTLYLATRASRRHHTAVAAVHDHLVQILERDHGTGPA